MPITRNTSTSISTNEQANTHNWVEITSESSSIDKGSKREKSFSPMSITTEVSSDDGEKKNNSHPELTLDGVVKNSYRELKLKIKTKTAQVKKLKKDLKKSSEKLKSLIKEKKEIGKKITTWKEQNPTDISNVISRKKDLENILSAEKAKLIDRETEVKKIWNTIQTLDDVNVQLQLDAETWKEREEAMMDELLILKEELERYKNQQRLDDSLYISPTAKDWKHSMDWQKRHGWRKLNFDRSQMKGNSEAKFSGWQEKRMKFRSRGHVTNKMNLSRESNLAKVKPGRKINHYSLKGSALQKIGCRNPIEWHLINV